MLGQPLTKVYNLTDEGNYPRGDLLHRHRSALGAVERSKLPKQLGEPKAKFRHLTAKYGISGSFSAS